MLISLSEIMNLSRIEKQFTCEYGEDVFQLNGSDYRILEKKSIDLTVRNLGDKKLSITAKSFFVIEVPCGRCLVPQRVEIPVDFSNEIDMNISSAERAQDLDETEYISGYDLDVDRLIYEEILLGFPTKVLCDEDCKGLCKVCGHNLNEGE
ncbi:MAG: DUF177 domain-containing protein, partial [Lachnospiraceae bacterium]|nr:DUF177 domain-containing protein [Lachnospiraceae bacterium]